MQSLETEHEPTARSPAWSPQAAAGHPARLSSPSRRSGPGNQGGFSLMESMMALILLAITMLGVIQLFGVAIRQNSFARNNTLALSVAQETLERLRVEYTNELEGGTASSNLTDGTHTPAPVTRAAPAGSGMGDQVFQVSWTVTSAGSTRTVAVTVVPAANDFESKTLTMTSVFSP